jgi:two-component system sensor kinase
MRHFNYGVTYVMMPDRAMVRRPFSTLTIAKKGFLLVALPLVAQIVFGVALLAASRKAVEAHARELHSQHVLTETYAIKTALLIAQGSLRGYVLTRNADFLTDCRVAERDVPTAIARLSRLVADNALQSGRVREMAKSAAAVLDFQNVNANLVLGGRRDAAVSLVGTQAGKRLMERFLVPADAFLATEQRLAEARHAQASASNRMAITVVAIGFALNILLASGLALSFTAGINRRLGVLTENAQRLAAGRQLLPPLSPGDEIAGVDGVFREMAASLTKATEDLQHANGEMEAFSYSVSHDLRSPLRAIEGFSRILVEEYGGTLDAEGIRILGVIRRNTVTMAQLIDDLLTFSRLSRQQIARVEVDMRELAARTFAEVAGSDEHRKIEFVLDDIPPAKGDLPMLRQVLTNLLSNAVKFSQPREQPRIEVGTLKNGEAGYFVRDNGVGFDMKYANKLFGVFQRLHSANDFSGTGVGLAIVERVVHRHGGKVWADSAPGEGATFFFTLPESGGGNDA